MTCAVLHKPNGNAAEVLPARISGESGFPLESYAIDVGERKKRHYQKMAHSSPTINTDHVLVWY